MVRPDSEDLEDTELREAAEAIEESERWRSLFHRQQSFDREIASAMQNVDVPDGLRARLNDALDAAAQTTSQAVPHDRPVSRRKLFATVGTAAGLLMAVTLAWMLVPRGGTSISLAEARRSLPTTVDGTIVSSQLEEFDEAFGVSLPDPAWLQHTVAVADLKGIDWDRDQTDDAAVYEFRAGRVLHGYLLIVPTSRISDPPTQTQFSTSGIEYDPVTNTVWNDPRSGLTYICYVDQGDLETLRRTLYPLTA